MIRNVAVISFLLAGCASPTQPERHQILGTTYGWDKEHIDTEVLLDAKINKLLVRHVKLAEPGCGGGFREHIEISGEIGPDSTEALRRLLPQVKPCKLVSGNGYNSVRVFSVLGVDT